MSRSPKTQRPAAESRGSVLIFVVGVLLLLSIIATAFLGSSRSDRVSTQQNAFNTQIDLLLEGVVNAGRAKIASDDSVPARQTLGSTARADAYNYYNDTANGTDNWLASRVPVTFDRNGTYTPLPAYGNSVNAYNEISNPVTQNAAFWPAVTAPVLGDGFFESPYRPATTFRNGTSFSASSAKYTGSLVYSTRPTAPVAGPIAALNAAGITAWPSFVQFGGQSWPAFIVDTRSGPTPANADAATRYQKFLAADADGDGVADSGLFRIPIGQIAGITYYGAVRIVDNNAAVNLNTAQSRDGEFTGAGLGGLISTNGTMAGAWTSNVGLAELLRTYNPVASGMNNFANTSTTTSLTNNKATPSSSYSFNEFLNFNKYRLNNAVAPYIPGGVLGNTADSVPYDDTPISGTAKAGLRTANSTTSPEFQFLSIGDALTSQLGSRPTNPGATVALGTAARSPAVDSLALAGRFSIGGQTEYSPTAPTSSESLLARNLSLTLEYVPSYGVPLASSDTSDYLLRTTPYTSLTVGAGIDSWFTQHFNYLYEQGNNASATTPATFMNRRTILTGYNGLGTAVASGTPTAEWTYLFTTNSPQWTGNNFPAVQHDVNVYRPYPPLASSTLPYMTQPPFNGFLPTLPMFVPSVNLLTDNGLKEVPDGSVLVDSKVSLNTGRFEELFYGYFKTMARDGFTGRGDDLGTPFSLFYNNIQKPIKGLIEVGGGPVGNNSAIKAKSGIAFNAGLGNYAATGLYYADPYIGSRFTDGGIAHTYANRIDTQPSVVTGQTNEPEQHPLRMFRSPLRASGERFSTTPPAAVWNNSTPRLPADQVLILRAALAAANLEALRDSSQDPAGVLNHGNDRIAEHRIPLTAVIGGTRTPVVARVFGLKRQPYITEVYANTTNVNDYDASFPSATVNPVAPNPRGYVAIKLYNPHPVAISLRYCRLVGLRRHFDGTPITTNPATTQYPAMQVADMPSAMSAYPTSTPPAGPDITDQIDLGDPSVVTNATFVSTPLDPWVIPAGGTLVLENYPATNTTGDLNASPHADDATHRPASAGFAATTGLVTASGTQNYAYVPGLQRVVWDRELVLMRPTNCEPPTAATVPANTLTYTFANPTLTAPNVPVTDMVPLDSFDFTGLNVPDTSLPARLRAEAWHYTRQVDTAAPWRWVYPGRYDANQTLVPPTAGEGTAPRQQGTFRVYGSDGLPGWAPASPTDKDPLVNVPQTTPAGRAFVSTLAAGTVNSTARFPDRFTIQLNVDGWPSDNKLHDATSGLGPNLWPFGGFRRLGDMLQAPFIGSYTIQTEANAVAGTPTFLEVNAVTMDAAMADDTDPYDNETETTIAADNGTQCREQLGRFVPLRPSVGTTANGKTNGDGADFVSDSTYLPGNVSPLDLNSLDQGNDDHIRVSINPNYGVLDARRYRDDLVEDNITRPLPVGGSPVTDAPNIRTNRYQWASTLFDHFQINTPTDDYVPNYPTQPKWQPGTRYVVGDTVQFGQNAYVCRTAHTSGIDPPASTELNAGTPAKQYGSPPNYVVMPTVTANWMPLPRNALANSAAYPGNHSDIVPRNALNPTAGRSFDNEQGDDAFETPVPQQGLVNINTAPEKVLAMLPWLLRGTGGGAGDRLTFNWANYPGTTAAPLIAVGSDNVDDNAQIAHLISLYRDGNYGPQAAVLTNNVNVTAGNFPALAHAPQPFNTLWDLYKVPGFLQAQSVLIGPAGSNPGYEQGDFSPAVVGGNDNVRYDFEEQALLLNRVSNLVTTRSDVFTLYALVQGWRNVGTDNPQLVVQRRAAYIIDRSGVTRTSSSVTSTKVPVN